ncbi:GatB/YqeY domain-containing protein [Candidatus Azambacteria bacterium]|nr:GatB/YqeY domain-containing protein [Candidatus Azambacteria bacterium]
MTLAERLAEDLKEALKQGEERRTSTLRLLSSAVHNKELEKRARSGKAEVLSDEELLEVIRSEAKKRREAEEAFRNGGREDLAEKEAAEREILKSYLPAELSEEEVKRRIEGVIRRLGASSKADMGRVMGEAMKELKGQAEGGMVRQVVEALLQRE